MKLYLLRSKVGSLRACDPCSDDTVRLAPWELAEESFTADWVKNNPPVAEVAPDMEAEKTALLYEKATLESKVAEISVNISALDAKIAAKVMAPK